MNNLILAQALPLLSNGNPENLGYDKAHFLQASLEDWQEILFDPKITKFSKRVSVYEHPKAKIVFFFGAAPELFLRFGQCSVNQFTNKQQREFWKMYDTKCRIMGTQMLFTKLEQHENPEIILENFISYKKVCNPKDWAMTGNRIAFLGTLERVCQKPQWKENFGFILKNNIENKDWQFLIKTIISQSVSMSRFGETSYLQELTPQLLSFLDKKELVQGLEKGVRHRNKML